MIAAKANTKCVDKHWSSNCVFENYHKFYCWLKRQRERREREKGEEGKKHIKNTNKKKRAREKNRSGERCTFEAFKLIYSFRQICICFAVRWYFAKIYILIFKRRFIRMVSILCKILFFVFFLFLTVFGR